MKKLLIIILFLSLPLGVYAIVQTHSTDLELDSTQWWSITDNASLSLTTDFTLEGWFKFESLPSIGGERAFHGKWSGVNRSYFWELFNNGGTPRIQWGFNSDGSTQTMFATNFTPNTGQWYHFAITADISVPSGTFYIDTVSQSVSNISTSATSIEDTGGDYAIGAFSDGTIPFDGLIKDARVWNDVRTGGEIVSEWKNCNLSPSETGLVSWWGFNNNGLDETSSDNDLTNNNSATFVTDLPYTCAATGVNEATIISIMTNSQSTIIGI